MRGREIEERCFSVKFCENNTRRTRFYFSILVTVLVTSQQIDNIALVYDINHRLVKYLFLYSPVFSTLREKSPTSN